jgi:hypothetical protein
MILGMTDTGTWGPIPAPATEGVVWHYGTGGPVDNPNYGPNDWYLDVLSGEVYHQQQQ